MFVDARVEYFNFKIAKSWTMPIGTNPSPFLSTTPCDVAATDVTASDISKHLGTTNIFGFQGVFRLSLVTCSVSSLCHFSYQAFLLRCSFLVPFAESALLSLAMPVTSLRTTLLAPTPPSSPLLAPTSAQDPDTETGAELDHVSSANAIVDPTVFDIFKTFGHRALGNNMTEDTPSIADATVLDLFKAFGHSTDLVSEPSNPMNVNKHPSLSRICRDPPWNACKRRRFRT
jgi:hypothetical protein